MAELNLEKQIERMGLVMDTYLDFCQTNDREVLDPKIQELKKLELIDDLRIDKWIIAYEAQMRNDSGIKDSVGYDLFYTLFNPKEEDRIKFLGVNIQLGLSFLNLYSRKIKGLDARFSSAETDQPLNEVIKYLDNLEMNEPIFSEIGCISKKEIINDYLKIQADRK